MLLKTDVRMRVAISCDPYRLLSLNPYRLLFQPLILEYALITGDYGILSRNMQHLLNWDRKEYIFQYLFSTIVLDFMEFQMIVAMAENCE